MELLLQEIIENRKRLLSDLKMLVAETKNDFKYLKSDTYFMSPQYKYHDLAKFIESNKYQINIELLDLCNSYISDLIVAINNKQYNSSNTIELVDKTGFLFQTINEAILKYT